MTCRHGNGLERIAARAAGIVMSMVILGSSTGAGATPSAEEDTTTVPSATLIPFPFYMYSPETKSGVGVVVTYLRRSPDGPADQKPAFHSASVLLTQRKQLVVGVGLERYGSDERYHVQAGAVFSEFPNTFFGVGNDTQDDVSEDYTPRTTAVTLGVRKEVFPDLRVGPHVGLVHEEMEETEDGGVLESGGLPGSDGGTILQLGASANRDRRDNTIYPRSGTLSELSVDLSSRDVGSDFDYTSWNLDLRAYHSLSSGQVVAVRGLATVMTGTPPIQSLAQLGGDSVIRGFYEVRFRERNRYVLQAEYRLGFWTRTGLVAFADVGDVAHDLSDFRRDEARFAGGIGLRFLLSRAEGVTLRADLATGDDGTGGVYLSMLEAY